MSKSKCLTLVSVFPVSLKRICPRWFRVSETAHLPCWSRPDKVSILHAFPAASFLDFPLRGVIWGLCCLGKDTLSWGVPPSQFMTSPYRCINIFYWFPFILTNHKVQYKWRRPSGLVMAGSLPDLVEFRVNTVSFVCFCWLQWLCCYFWGPGRY